MKLGLLPCLSVALSVALLVLPRSASAGSPGARLAPSSRGSQEDALADGDIDVEDIAIASPLRSLARPIGAHRVLGRGPGGPAYLSLVGFSRRTLEDLREVGGFVVVGLPLDRLAQGRRTTRIEPVDEAMPELVPASAVSPPGPAPPPAASGTTEHIFDLALTPRLARSCVASAWQAAGLGGDDGRLDAILSRARWSSILPEARFRAVRFEDARLSLDSGTDTSRLRDSAGANIGFEARLTWRFDRLIYADDEPSLERIRLEHRDARTRIAAKVLEALFHWQRASLDLRTLPPSQLGTRDEADVLLRVMEAEAALDVLTGGWFTAYRAARRPTADRGRKPGTTGEL